MSMRFSSLYETADYARDRKTLQAFRVSHILIGTGSLASVFVQYRTLDTHFYITAALFALSMLWVYRPTAKRLGYERHPACYALSYQIILAIVILISPHPSMFPMLWLSGIFVIDVILGVKLAQLSFMALAIVLGVLVVWSGFSEQQVQYSVLLFGISGGMFFMLRFLHLILHSQKELVNVSVDSVTIERQRLTALINSMTDGFIATDSKSIIRMYNAAALSILDTNQSIRGKDIREVLALHDKSGKRNHTLDQAIRDNKMLISSDLQLKYPNDESINIYLNFSPIRTGFGRTAEFGYITTFRDITKEKSLEEERDEFISVISHELRTPIAVSEASISNALFMIKRGGAAKATDAALEAAHAQVRYLASIVNDLSTLARAERGALTADLSRVNIQELLNSLQHDYEIEAKQKGLSLSTHLAKNVQEELTTSPLYLREVLQNFITNAIKYTETGGVSIKVTSGKDHTVDFEIIDTGIGLSISDQKKIFQKFFRSEDYRTRKSNGTGLGLYITKKLTKMIQADITVQSTLNKGSSFTLHVPDLSNTAN